MKVLNQYHLEVNCRIAGILKPRAIPTLHSSGFEACAVRRVAPLLHGKVSGCCHLLQEEDGERVAAVNFFVPAKAGCCLIVHSWNAGEFLPQDSA